MSISTYIRENRIDDTLAIGTSIQSAIGGTACGIRAGIADEAVCVGYEAGQNCEEGAVCLGRLAGRFASQNSIYIGNFAGSASAGDYDNTIMLSAIGNNQAPDVSNALYVLPVRRSDGSTYSRSFDYTSRRAINPDNTPLVLGSWTVDPSSTCISGSIYSSSNPQTNLASEDAFNWLLTQVYTVTDQSGNVIETFTDLSRNINVNGIFITPAVINQSWNLNPVLYNTTTSSRTFTVTLRVSNNFPSSSSVEAGIYLGAGDVSPQPSTGIHTVCNLSLGVDALPILHYDPGSGEITYSYL